jgi:hypothetical protein
MRTETYKREDEAVTPSGILAPSHARIVMAIVGDPVIEKISGYADKSDGSEERGLQSASASAVVECCQVHRSPSSDDEAA